MRKLARRSLAVVAVLASAAGIVAVSAPRPAAAVEQPPSELLLDRYSGRLGDAVRVWPRKLCPAGTASVGFSLHDRTGSPWGTSEYVYPNGGWDTVQVPFDDTAPLTGRTALLHVMCHPSSGQANMEYEDLRFELKNGAFWWQPDGLNQQVVTRVYPISSGGIPILPAWRPGRRRWTAGCRAVRWRTPSRRATSSAPVS
jgi:hypothetical protein